MKWLRNSIIIIGLAGIISSIGLVSYGKAQPEDVNNICKIFEQYPSWYVITKKTDQNWDVPIHVQMAFMWQESRFIGTAKLGRQQIVLDHKDYERPISYGYSQAEYGTWLRYEHTVGIHAKRTSFAASANFIGWYANLLHRYLNIPVDDTYQLYLAYHEGIGGYRAKSYDRKPWLIQVAHRVAATASRYEQQLLKCTEDLDLLIGKLYPHGPEFEGLLLVRKKPPIQKTDKPIKRVIPQKPTAPIKKLPTKKAVPKKTEAKEVPKKPSVKKPSPKKPAVKKITPKEQPLKKPTPKKPA